MTKSTKILAAALMGAIVTVAAMTVASLNGSASAATGSAEIDYAAERIGGAFATLSGYEHENEEAAAVEQGTKGDLPVRPGCVNETWPNIAPECLVTTDGTEAPRVRYVTVDYQSDETTTVLVRIPAVEVQS